MQAIEAAGKLLAFVGHAALSDRFNSCPGFFLASLACQSFVDLAS
jgi:hypothetical protein